MRSFKIPESVLIRIQGRIAPRYHPNSGIHLFKMVRLSFPLNSRESARLLSVRRTSSGVIFAEGTFVFKVRLAPFRRFTPATASLQDQEPATLSITAFSLLCTTLFYLYTCLLSTVSLVSDGVKLLWSFCLTTLPMLCNQTPLPTIRPDQDLCCSIDRRIVLFFFEYTPVPTTMNCIL